MAKLWEGKSTTSTTPESRKEVITDPIRYVNKVDSGGWLQIRQESGAYESLYKYTKVQLLHTKAGRTYFKVMDGKHKGLDASLKDANAAEYLGKKAPTKSAVEMLVIYVKYQEDWYSEAKRQKLNQQFATVSIAGITAQATMNSVWKENKNWKGYYPIEPGEYPIMLPDSPHKKEFTDFYKKTEPSLVNDRVWFPIQFGNNSRFVHVGNVSEGCTTIIDLGKWAAIHEALISHRAADGVSVGTMIVKGKRERILEKPIK